VKQLCEAMIPLLGVLLVLNGYKRRPLAVVARLATALTWVYLFHFGDMYFKVWKGWGLNFSAHTGVALAVGCTLAGMGRLWTAITFVVWIIYASLMLKLGYHTLADILTTSAAVLPGAIAAQFLLRPRGTVDP